MVTPMQGGAAILPAALKSMLTQYLAFEGKSALNCAGFIPGQLRRPGQLRKRKVLHKWHAHTLCVPAHH
jgi:hypothetical protein